MKCWQFKKYASYSSNYHCFFIINYSDFHTIDYVSCHNYKYFSCFTPIVDPPVDKHVYDNLFMVDASYANDEINISFNDSTFEDFVALVLAPSLLNDESESNKETESLPTKRKD